MSQQWPCIRRRLGAEPPVWSAVSLAHWLPVQSPSAEVACPCHQHELSAAGHPAVDFEQPNAVLQKAQVSVARVCQAKASFSCATYR